jgi:predicted CXXCH cytochrome family protein
MRTKLHRAIPAVLILAGTAALVSCVDEDVVYEDRPVYQRIADEALGYLGYADPSSGDQLTFCGQCHGGLQADWEATAHAGAWAGLQESDHAQAFCEACHTVNSLGNVHPTQVTPGEAVGGHVAVDDGRRYHDVQCESCHGPGLEHTLDPRASNVPMAGMQVGSDLAYGCGECHSGTHHPFVTEWEASPHGNVLPFAAMDPDCFACHSGEGALQALGVTGDYLEKDALLGSDEEYAPITCVVCHDPHDATHTGQLRFPMEGVQPEATLCGQCHNRRAAPDTQGNQDWLQPHSAEAALLAGSAGWFPPGSSLTPGSITGPHGAGSNQRLCASCHVVAYSATDGETGEQFFSVGHGFRAAPCVAENGLPSGAVGCALTTTARSFEGCATGECHPDASDASSNLDAALGRILAYAEELNDYLDALGSEINPDDGRLSVAEGALFNHRLATTRTSFRPNQSTDARRRALAPSVTHNPAFIEQLLVETIAAVEAAYPAVAASVAEARAQRSGS